MRLDQYWPKLSGTKKRQKNTVIQMWKDLDDFRIDMLSEITWNID